MLVSGSGARVGSGGGISESSPNGDTAMGGVGERSEGDSGGMSAKESGESGRRTVSPARAVKHESKDCISRKARGNGRMNEGERREGVSKATPGPNGYGIYPPSVELRVELPEYGEGGTAPADHCMASAKISVVDDPGTSTPAPTGK